jgi:predicted lipoprotein with Yx(FWY)xxD motif
MRRFKKTSLAAVALLLLATTSLYAQNNGQKPAVIASADAPVPADITIQRTPAPTLLGDTTGVRLEGYDSGSVFADAKGLTLYTFDRDTAPGVSTCVGACARLWRPAAAPEAASAVGDWTVIVSAEDETRQWAYKGKPVYTYAGDVNPGDALGDGVDGVWRIAVAHNPFRPAEVTLSKVDGRPVLADAHGLTLYTFDGDENLGPDFSFDLTVKRGGGRGGAIGHCINSCAKTWRALLAPADAKPPAGDWSLVEREDDPSKKQWAFRKYPLYTYAGDAKPGDANGVDVKYGPDYAFSTMFRVASTETGRF